LKVSPEPNPAVMDRFFGLFSIGGCSLRVIGFVGLICLSEAETLMERRLITPAVRQVTSANVTIRLNEVRRLKRLLLQFVLNVFIVVYSFHTWRESGPSPFVTDIL
jgi:hypothetical protein